MRLIKLDATSSTNDFLKELAANQTLENFTVVCAESQTKGRGQMGSEWISEKGKNLTMSVLNRNTLSNINQIFDLNIAVSLAVIAALEQLKIPKLLIKWPNDIMSGEKKIGGILIENVVKSTGQINSIIGIGLNVNQTDFINLPKASSLAVVSNQVFDKELILETIVENLETSIHLIESPEILWQNYRRKLFKIDVPMPFEDKNGFRFMGIIQNVTPVGKLILKLEDDSLKEFEIKEITMLY